MQFDNKIIVNIKYCTTISDEFYFFLINQACCTDEHL